LFNRAAVPVARPGVASAFIAGRRVVAIDGVVLDVPDTAENAAEFGYSGKEDVNRSAFPQVRMATLSEIGTHATIGAAMGCGASRVSRSRSTATTFCTPCWYSHSACAPQESVGLTP
jgi:hypothetical protein